MFETVLTDGCNAIGVQLTPETIYGLKTYCSFLLEYNQNVNLTAITDEDDVALKHFVDCLTAVKLIPHGACCCDIGTGAGFPGMVIAMARPDISMTLFDSLDKRLEFLRLLAQKTGVNNVTTVHARAEDAGANPLYREKYDIALSRAVARASVLCEYTLPFIKVGGKLIALKGPSANDELKDAANAIKLLGGGNARITPALTVDGQNHVFLTVDKLKHTDKKYPRKAGTPAKQPL